MQTYLVSQVSFGEDGSVTIHWADPNKVSDLGGTYFTTVITPAAAEADQVVGYYLQELKEDVDELVAAWLKLERGGR